MQLSSLRSNQRFIVDYKTGKMIPQTEIILLIEEPKYTSKGDKIIRGNQIKELRFETSTSGLKQLIGMLEEAIKVSDEYEKLGGIINNALTSKEQLK